MAEPTVRLFVVNAAKVAEALIEDADRQMDEGGREEFGYKFICPYCNLAAKSYSVELDYMQNPDNHDAECVYRLAKEILRDY